MLNFENFLIFHIEQFWTFDHFLNQSIIVIWKMANWVKVKISNGQVWKWLTFRIWKLTNAERPNLRVTRIEHENWEDKA